MTMEPLSLFDLEAHAETVLHPHAWAFIAGGAQDEVTMRRNRSAFEAITLNSRFMVDISTRDLSTTVLGERISFPVMIAPAWGHKTAHPDGELATARGAGAAGTLMGLATGSHYSIEQVAEAATGPLWFALYHMGTDLTEMLVRRAEQAGYKAICLVADTPVPSPIERSIRHGSVRPGGFEPANFVGEEAGLGLVSGTLQALSWTSPPTIPLAWSDLKWLRSLTSLPLVLKGLRTAEDAALAVEHGVEGILISNHGGRQFDGSPSSIEALPAIVDAVNGKAEVYLDSGIRRGSDVLKALALGARAVLIGRPLFWGLAWEGDKGVHLVLEILRRELDVALAYCGRTSVRDLDNRLVNLPTH